ncbi:unnamed protein product [Schistocephalus solidus]|uniref:Flocculation protein FLO11-like n=1 Tax=Schistocephalus solidus TaxID=70667 RepID=A0A183TKC5_SCHSO|nr:unnamed protein product [Schistocephalus solidus]
MRSRSSAQASSLTKPIMATAATTDQVTAKITVTTSKQNAFHPLVLLSKAKMSSKPLNLVKHSPKKPAVTPPQPASQAKTTTPKTAQRTRGSSSTTPIQPSVPSPQPKSTVPKATPNTKVNKNTFATATKPTEIGSRTRHQRTDSLAATLTNVVAAPKGVLKKTPKDGYNVVDEAAPVKEGKETK